jgi:hypothetical protein
MQVAAALAGATAEVRAATGEGTEEEVVVGLGQDQEGMEGVVAATGGAGGEDVTSLGVTKMYVWVFFRGHAEATGGRRRLFIVHEVEGKDASTDC